MQTTVFLVDAMAYIFRAYYSRQEESNSQDPPTNASFGFLDFVLRLLERENPSHIGIVFDSGPKSFRNEIYPEYKINREETPRDLLPQFAQCESLIEALGIPGFKLENYEADDILATLSTRFHAAGHSVTIISGDKDFAQLVTDTLTVRDPARQRHLTPRSVKRRFGVTPEQMVDYLALTGDASDNIPGVRGVGPKTASALLQSLDSLDSIYDSLERVPELPIRGARNLAARLEEQRENAYLSRRLVVLRRDLPLDAELADLEYRGASRERCEALFTELGFMNFLPFVRKWQ